jgi:hypothetical protein
MKTSYAVVFFVLLFLIIGGVFLFLSRQDVAQPKILLQTLRCSSDKIDRSILDLDGRTSLIGAMISFKKVPLADNLKNKLTAWQVELDEKSWIFDYVIAKIPTKNLCSLVQEEQVTNVFIPQVK